MPIITIIIFIMVGGISSAGSSDYIWPMKLRPELTSRFCDYRAGHFHGGLDIRTGGVTGVPVYAIGDGYIFRATTSFKGYGKALYLKLKDGRIIVYGHLSGFFTALDDRILAAQLREKRYRQDLYFKTTDFPVKKGQRVALSGESGTGAPHLHFEMRSAENNPINPLESGYSLADKVPPELDELAIRYYDHGFGPGKPCEI
jgi:murein DD-endopeptidase MepM/ murein hydrolase activator NlpD